MADEFPLVRLLSWRPDGRLSHDLLVSVVLWYDFKVGCLNPIFKLGTALILPLSRLGRFRN